MESHAWNGNTKEMQYNIKSDPLQLPFKQFVPLICKIQVVYTFDLQDTSSLYLWFTRYKWFGFLICKIQVVCTSDLQDASSLYLWLTRYKQFVPLICKIQAVCTSDVQDTSSLYLWCARYKQFVPLIFKIQTCGHGGNSFSTFRSYKPHLQDTSSLYLWCARHKQVCTSDVQDTSGFVPLTCKIRTCGHEVDSFSTFRSYKPHMTNQKPWFQDELHETFTCTACRFRLLLVRSRPVGRWANCCERSCSVKAESGGENKCPSLPGKEQSVPTYFCCFGGGGGVGGGNKLDFWRDTIM